MPISGGNQFPYRDPCAGSVTCSNGPRYQHARVDEQNVPVFICDTRLPNAYIPPRGDLVPYERFADLSSGPNCATDFCGGGVPAPCIGWIGTATNNGSGPQFDLEFPPPTNTFYQPQMITGISIVSGGANYLPGDALNPNGGTSSGYLTPDGSSFPGPTIVVGTVSNTGAILTAGLTSGGSYKTPPDSPNLPVGGHGTGAEFDFTTANQTENLSPCQKIGYKNVQAKRQWHGQPGYFFNSNPDVYTCNDPTYGTACDTARYDQYSLSASQTKYLDASFEITGTFAAWNDCDSSVAVGIFTDTCKADLSVDANSGVINVSNAAYGCGGAAWFASLVPQTLDYWVDRFTDMLGTSVPGAWPNANEFFGPDAGPSGTFSLSCNAAGYEFSGSPTGDVNVTQSGSGSWTFSAGGFSATRTYTSEQLNDDDTKSGVQETESIDITDDSLIYTYNQQVENESVWITNFDFTVTISFSNTNTATDVLTDLYSLLDEWDLTDDAVYPWRTDSYTSIAPLVMRNEPGNNVAPLDFAASVFTANATHITDCFGNSPGDPDYIDTCGADIGSDENALLYDGSIIGAPLPAGYQQTFDWYYTDWQSCDTTGYGDIVGYIEGWGKLNQNQNGIPRTATHWTTNDLAWQFTGGAWVFYNLNTAWSECVTGGSGTWPAGVVLIAQKWAETKVGFPSENFFRPAGDDKFAYDENHVYTIDTITGSGPGAQVKLQLALSCDSPNGSSQPISSISGLWGGPSVNGFYELSSISGGDTVTLGTKVYDVPSNWMSASDWQGADESNDTFGRLRWSTGAPSNDPPPILGRAAIANFGNYNGSNTVTELATGPLPDLGMGIANADHIDIFDNTMTVVASNLAVMRIDDTHFTVNANAGSLTNAAWIMSHDAPNFSWDDQYPKGDYVYHDWTYWPRLICEAVRFNTLVNSCNSSNCSCPNESYTKYCFPFFNAVEDNAGVFDHAFTQDANCVPFSPCNPSVLCISPNDESFAVGATYGFPNAGSLYLDEQYGSGWFSEFQQVIVDPLWQTPHFPASQIGNCNASNNAFEWTMDDGFCQEDSGGNAAIEYYPLSPLVEARLEVPGGAPSLPNGITLGWESPAGLTNCNAVPSDTLFPPGPIGYGLSAPQPIWSIWSLECQCADARGRFSDAYENEVIGCS